MVPMRRYRVYIVPTNGTLREWHYIDAPNKTLAVLAFHDTVGWLPILKVTGGNRIGN